MYRPDRPEEFVISPPARLIPINWRELWRYRDLFLVFSWREVSVRYKQTLLGIVWVMVQPLAMMFLFTFIFNGLAKIETSDDPTNRIPYPIFLFVGLLLWQYFSNTLTNASNSMIQNSAIIQKVYFPRLIVPASSAAAGLVDLGFSAIVLVGLMTYYGYYPYALGVAILPLLLACAVMYSLGLGLFLASLNIRFRDVRHALPFTIQIMMYVTPVIYPVTLLDNHPVIKNLIIWLNPMSGVIVNARNGLLGRSPIDWELMGISALMSFIYFVFGLYYFRATERSFADVI